MSTENGSDLVRPGSISKKLCDLSQYTKYQRIKVNELIERTHPHRACARSLASEKKNGGMHMRLYVVRTKRKV